MSERVLAQPQSVSAPAKAVKDSFSLEHREKKQTEQTTLPELLFDIGLGTFAEPRVGFDFSRVPALTGMERQTQPLLRTQPTSETAEPITETPASALIVEDSAADLAPGQMKKSEFLNQLKIEVCRTVEAAIAGTGRTTDECPYIDYWFDFYSRKESAHIERTIHRYAPEAANVTTAIGYIPVFTQRARQAAETWARTGEITGVPEGLPMSLPGMGLLGGIGRLFSGVGSIFFKARNGGARKPDDPRAIQAELGEGQPLNSGVRSRMESAFGMDFAHVRMHTDNMAAAFSNRFNARAFTIGSHVAFGAGEYQPGTVMGDGLIAHELAHVVQQSGGAESAARMKGGDATYNNLEKDADKSAIGAVASLFGGAKDALSDIAQNAVPNLRAGLRLQRCSVDEKQSQKKQLAQRPVHKAKIEVRSSGYKSPGNNKNFPPGSGGDKLGALTDEKDGIDIAEAMGKVEIVATLPPNAPNTGWDIKRIRYSRQFSNSKLFGKTTEDDTSTPNRKDLVPDPDRKIYDIDGPTCGFMLNLDHGTMEVYHNFLQWVKFNGKAVSKGLEWHYHAIVDDRLDPKNWPHNNNTVLNDLGPGWLKLPDKSYFDSKKKEGGQK